MAVFRTGLRNCTPHTIKFGKSQINFSWLQFFQKMTENTSKMGQIKKQRQFITSNRPN